MTLQVACPGRDNAIKVTVLNGSTAAAISSGEAVVLSTGTAPNLYKVTRLGSTAGTVVRLFGVCEQAIPTGGTGPCTIYGPALAMGGGAITVKAPLTALYGTTGVRGRAVVGTAGTAGVADTGSYLGWAISVGSTGAFTAIFVNTAHCHIA